MVGALDMGRLHIGRMTHENLDIKSVQFKQNIASLPQASVDHQSKKQKVANLQEEFAHGAN